MTMQYEKETALALMANKTVLVNAGGIGHPYFSTDTITALRAAELEADCVLYAKNIDGVYEQDPLLFPGVKKYRQLKYITAITGNLRIADISALHLSKEAGIPSYMFELNHKDSILLACSYPETGSLQGTYINVETEEIFY
jgi:uridylate kinase